MAGKEQHPKGWPGIPCEGVTFPQKGEAWAPLGRSGAEWVGSACAYVEDNVNDARQRKTLFRLIPHLWAMRERDEAVGGEPFVSVSGRAAAARIGITQKTARAALDTLSADGGPLHVLASPGNQKWGTCYGFSDPLPDGSGFTSEVVKLELVPRIDNQSEVITPTSEVISTDECGNNSDEHGNKSGFTTSSNTPQISTPPKDAAGGSETIRGVPLATYYREAAPKPNGYADTNSEYVHNVLAYHSGPLTVTEVSAEGALSNRSCVDLLFRLLTTRPGGRVVFADGVTLDGYLDSVRVCLTRQGAAYLYPAFAAVVRKGAA